MGSDDIYRNPFIPGRFSDDEIAVATCLERMGAYVDGGPGFYSLAEASHDHYLSLMINPWRFKPSKLSSPASSLGPHRQFQTQEADTMIEAELIGAGRRGMFAYASYALKRPNEIKFVAVAEPDDGRRALFAKQHGIPEDMQFLSWDELFQRPQLCEALLICTQDQQHYEPTLKALEKGYHILLEKPMSATPWEVIRMAEEAER